MTITDTSTALDLAYTEQTAVAFTAGTIATIADCVTEVESKIQRGTLSTTTTPASTDVQRWLVRAKQELAEVRGYSFRRRYAYATLTSGTYRYAMPPDYSGGSLRVKDTTNDRDIELIPRHVYDMKYPDPSAESTNQPLACTVKNMEIWFIPPPNSALTIELEYERSGADNTPTDFSWLPELERFRCCDFALAESYEALHLYDRMQHFRTKWGGGLMKSIRADGRRRWNKHNYQATSVFQAHAARSYQPTSE